MAEEPQPTADEDVFLQRLARIRVTHPDNLCARYLSRELFLSYGADQRRRLMACCRSGVENPDSTIGCYILAPQDLHAFAAFFGPLIGDHQGAPPPRSSGHDPEPLDLGALGVPVLSTRVRVARNLKGFALPAGMDRAERILLERSMTGALQALIADSAHGGRVFSLTPDFGPGEPNPNRIDADRYRALVEDHLMFGPMDQDPYMTSGGLAADWPYGRACYVSQDRSVIVWIGEEDHLRIIGLQTGPRLLEAYDRLQTVLAAISALPGVAFVRDDAYGYVASCPSNLGTGLRASARVVLPELSKPGVDAAAVCRRIGLSARGPAGEHGPIGADGRVDLSPIRRAFLQDQEMLAALVEGIDRLREVVG